ncbi:MAG: amidohydrolase family protein [Bacteroidetes bacterium]|nr:amidohydrolase family protein [Bacteroidota bacterium]
MDGEPVVDGVVLVRDGAIEQVGPASDVTIPDDYRTLTAAVVTPGLIDTRSVVGLAGILNSRHDQDQLETSDPVQPELRALDAYNAREDLVGWLRILGVTTVHTGHGPGAPISGQTMVVKTAGETVAEALVDSTAMMAMTLGRSVERNFDSPGTRAKNVSVLREALVEAVAYRDRQQAAAEDDETEPPDRNLKLEALGHVLDGEVPALVHAHTVPDIMAALRLAEEFDFPLVLDGAAEAYLVLDEIAAAGVPVLIHPPMIRTSGDAENAAFDTAARLHEAGIPFAFQSGYESYVPKTRVVLFEAAIAIANGLPRDAALAALTTGAAEVLGLGDRIGSLAPGNDADLVLYDGDPFEYTTHVCGVVIDGVLVSEQCK